MVFLLVWLFLWAASSVYALDLHQTLPSATSASFNSQNQTFLQQEDANRLADIIDTGFIVSGCLGATSANMIMAAFACTAYTNTGLYINQPAASINFTTAGCAADDTAWVIATMDTTAAPGGAFVRVAGTRYAVDCTNVAQPAAPTDSVLLFRATTAASAITVVADRRSLNPIGGWNNSFNVQNYGAVGDNSTNNLTALRNAYAACAALRGTLFIPDGTYRYSDTLTWDGSCNVRGQSKEFTILRKTANVTGIQLGSGGGTVGGEMTFENLTFDVVAGLAPNTANGVNIILCNRCTMRQILVTGHGGDGINHANGARMLFEQVQTISNTSVGIRINAAPKNANVNVLLDFDTRNNGSHGVELTSSDANVLLNVVSQNNTGYGIRIADGIGNYGVVYTENNTAGCVQLTSAAIRNALIITNSDAAGCIDDDAPTTNNNMIWDTGSAFGAALSVPTLFRHRPNTNVAGADLSVNGGQAGAGGVGQGGGRVLLSGGDAAGTAGAASGGDIRLNGGTQINGGANGIIALQGSSAGPVVVGANAVSAGSIGLEVQSTTLAFMPSRMSLAQANAMTMANGMILYCTDCAPGSSPCTAAAGGAFAFRQQGAWVCHIP